MAGVQGTSTERPQKLRSIANVCVVAVQGLFIMGFSLGFTSPVLADLKEQEGYTSLRKPIYQDLFQVRITINHALWA